MELPKSLRSTVRRFAGMRRRVRLTLSSGSTSVGPNDILRVRLPARSMIDLGSFGFSGLATLTGTDAAIIGSHSLIRRVGMTCGGQQLGYSNNQFNQVAQALTLATRGYEADKCNGYAGADPKQPILNNEAVEFNYFPQTPLSMGYLWTEPTGECEVDINFAGLEPLTVKKTGTVPTNWSISNIVAYVDVIQMETDDYAKAMRSVLAANGSYDKLVPLATAVVQQNTLTNSINVSSKCVDKVLFAPKAETYNAAAVQVDGQVYSKFLDFPTGATGVGADNSVYVEIGSTTFPAYGHSDRYAQLAQITRGCYGNGAYNFNKLFIGATGAGSLTAADSIVNAKSNYVQRNGVVLFPVGAFDDEGMEGGLDLSSGNSVIQFNSKGSALTTTRKCLLGALYKSTLSCKEGQVVGVQN